MSPAFELFHLVRPRLPRALAASLVFLLALACGESLPNEMPAPPATVARVVVLPDAPSLHVGEQLPLVARALDASGTEVPGQSFSWISTEPSIATVSAGGEVAALAPGRTIIKASVGDIIGAATLEVSRAPVAQVTIAPTSLELVDGETRILVPTARDARGVVLENRTATWTTDNAKVATVDASGLVTALVPGQANIEVTIEGIVARAEVIVSQAGVASVRISPSPVLVEVGEFQQLHATAFDILGRVVTGRPVTWSVDNTNATISTTGLLLGRRNGYVTVRATIDGISVGTGGTVSAPELIAYDLLYARHSAAGSSELFTLPIDGATAPAKVNAGNVSRAPTASPDGSRIAFAVSMTTLPTGAWIHDLYAVDIDGRNMRQLTTSPDIDDEPAWSPVGHRIAWHRWQPEGRSDIWLMHDDGSQPTNLTADMPDAGYRSAPAWSPDGQRIAFTEMRTTPAGTLASVWTMRADGSDKRELTRTLTGFDATPTWSADGSRIAFVRYYGADPDITLVDAGGGATTRIALPGFQSSPEWSPDGTLIAFGQTDGPRMNLYTIAPDGSRLRLRTLDAAWGGGITPAWIRRR